MPSVAAPPDALALDELPPLDAAQMPSSGGGTDRDVVSAVRSGLLSPSELDAVVSRVTCLSLVGSEQRALLESGGAAQGASAETLATHHALARRAAVECAVLLKNERQTLPLAPSGKLALIGAFAEHPRFQGSGSSKVNAHTTDAPLAAFRAAMGSAGQGGELLYCAGYDPVHASDDTALIEEAVAAARSSDAAVVIVGLTGAYEAEAVDREHMRMPRQMDALVAAVCAAQPRTVVVLCNGSPVTMPWIASCQALLEMYLTGEASGGAMSDLIFGVACPSGKLAETFPLAAEDCASRTPRPSPSAPPSAYPYSPMTAMPTTVLRFAPPPPQMPTS
jgi:beta-glucosidase